MNIPSPLTSFYTVLQGVCASAKVNTDLLRKNEAATRAALIDPILRALGWDTTDVRMVEPERSVEGKQILDYVLKDVKGSIAAIIEAKKLDESLDKLGHVGALIGYAFSLKPNKLFITDGLRWHYFSPAHSGYHPIETINLRETPIAEAAGRLVQWLDIIHSGYTSSRDIHLNNFSKADLSTSITQKQSTSGIIKAIEANKKFIPLTHISTVQLEPGQKPKQLQLPDGSIKSITTWKDILLEASEFTLKSSQQLTLPIPDKAGKTKSIFSLEKPTKGSSTATTYKGETIYIGTHYSASDCIANALHVIKLAPNDSIKTDMAVSF